MSAGGLPTDKTLQIEASRDPLGDWQVLLLSPLGSRLHFGLRLALEAQLQQRLGYRPQCLHHDDGILIRLADTDEPPLDLFAGLTPENIEELVLGQLADSALFALRFRQNAGRALLLPRMQPGKRAPLWLQRLRGRDLLQVARQFPDFPLVAETFREILHDHLEMPRLRQLLADVQSGAVQVVTRRAETPSPFGSGLLFAYTMAFMYEGDQTDSDSRRTPALDPQLLDQLVSPDRQGHLLDPRAIHQVERRLRGLGQPPRNSTEMAEWLRKLGDLTDAELEGPMAAFLGELQTDGRACRIELPSGHEPGRWILTEEEPLYRLAFSQNGDAHTAAAAILARFLETHALVGLADIRKRYPFEPGWAQRQLEEWAEAGRIVGVRPDAGAETLQWSAPANLDQVQRSSLALLRQEVVACPPPRFVDFVLHWQHLHPAAQRGTAHGLVEVLQRLHGLPLAATRWEQTILPGRVPGYQPRWLDEAIAGGAWAWVGQGEDLLAFWPREDLARLPVPSPPNAPAMDATAEAVLDSLRQRGASFVTDLAPALGLPPSVVRVGLWALLRRGLVTNDHFDVIRKGEPHEEQAAGGPGPLAAFRAARRRAGQRPEGRWSVLPWGRAEPEELALFLAGVLLNRYGIVCRELALMDPGMPAWRLLYEVLSRLELAGEVRRGYFVEGLSGAQFALPEAVRMLQDLDMPTTTTAPVVLVHSQDPGNLYGSGAPLDISLLDGGTRPLLRRPSNWLVLKAGQPLLIVEQQGGRLTALPSASRDDLIAAVGCLPAILTADCGLATRAKLTVAEWNGQPVTASPGRELLEVAGFVRDYQQMTLWAAWR
jgi:ATP-dependent Lhr-like helicase